jgi:small-conductance mechanosensitive channel
LHHPSHLTETSIHYLSDNWPTIAIAVGGLLILWAVDRLLARYGRRFSEKLPPTDRAMLETRYRLLRRVVAAVILVLAVGAVLFNIPSTRAYAQTVFASSAVLGLVIGFAARSTLANFVAGVMIAINQPVRLGDRVQVGDADGQVEDIGLTYTRLRTPDNRRVLIPNEELANSRVTNHTLVDSVSLAQIRVTVPLGADAVRVREVLSELVQVAPGRIGSRPDPGVSVAELTETGAVYSVAVWVPDPATAAQTSAWLRERSVSRLADEGVFRGVEAAVAK